MSDKERVTASARRVGLNDVEEYTPEDKGKKE